MGAILRFSECTTGLQLGDTVGQVCQTYGHPRSIEAAEHVHRIRAETRARRAGTVTDLEERRRAGEAS